MANPKNLFDEDEMARLAERLIFGGAPRRSTFFSGFDSVGPDRPAPFDTSAVSAYVQPIRTDVSWSDIVGNEEAKRALRLTLEDGLRHSDLMRGYGIQPSRGILLYGPPGCGKTMFAKAAAGAIGGGDHYLLVSGNNLRSMYYGETEQNIAKLFAHARKYKAKYGQPLLIFIDEADSILPPRGSFHELNDRIVAQFLQSMDGLEENAAFLILASNRPDDIDEAILRDGRISRKIEVKRPDYDACLDIIGNALSGVPCQSDFSTYDLAVTAAEALFHPRFILQDFTAVGIRLQEGHPEMKGKDLYFCLSDIVSGAMAQSVVDRAKLLAFERDRNAGTSRPSGVTHEDLAAAVEEIFRDNKGLHHHFALQEFVERKMAELNRKEMN